MTTIAARGIHIGMTFEELLALPGRSIHEVALDSGNLLHYNDVTVRLAEQDGTWRVVEIKEVAA